MTRKQALQLALSILVPFQEAGQIYEDYIEDEGITDREYEDMLGVLAALQEELAN